MKKLMVTMLTVFIIVSAIPLHTYGQDSAEVVILSPKVTITVRNGEQYTGNILFAASSALVI